MPSRSATKGFVFMDTPGYDPVSATGQVAGGAQRHLLYHGARLGVRLQAGAEASSSRPTPPLYLPHGIRYGHRLRPDRRRRGHRLGNGAGASSTLVLATASGRKTQERATRLRRGRVHPLGTRRRDVTARYATRKTFPSYGRKTVRGRTRRGSCRSRPEPARRSLRPAPAARSGISPRRRSTARAPRDR